MLGIKLDSNLNFNSHIHDICQKAGQKLISISRITPYMDFSQRRLLVNAFFYSQFNCSQLLWMCHNGTSNKSLPYIGSKSWQPDLFVLMQNLICKVYLQKKLFVVSKKKKKKEKRKKKRKRKHIYVQENQNAIIVFSHLPYVVDLGPLDHWL